MRGVLWLAILLPTALSLSYKASVTKRCSQPVVSYLRKTTQFQQSFNPSWFPPSVTFRNGHPVYNPPMLAVRGQNCTASPGNDTHCEYIPTVGGGAPSVVAALRMVEPADALADCPRFEEMDSSTVVFSPQGEFEIYGTEDPRVVFNTATLTYHMMYTCVGACGNYSDEVCSCEECSRSVLLCHASTQEPANPSSWRRHGAVLPKLQNSKSGAVLLRDRPPHYMYYIVEKDSNAILIASTNSSSLDNWTATGKTLIEPRPDKGPAYWDSQLVESGPPPLPLSTGDFIFFYNGHNDSYTYQAGWLVINGTDPTSVVARADEPLLPVDYAWEKGTPPELSNVKNVVFLEAAHPIEGMRDAFRVYFGAADTTVGTAVVQITVDW